MWGGGYSLDLSRSHSAAVGVLVAGSRLAGVFEGAALTGPSFKARKTIAARLKKEDEMVHTDLYPGLLHHCNDGPHQD